MVLFGFLHVFLTELYSGLFRLRPLLPAGFVFVFLQLHRCSCLKNELKFFLFPLVLKPDPDRGTGSAALNHPGCSRDTFIIDSGAGLRMQPKVRGFCFILSGAVPAGPRWHADGLESLEENI